MRRTQQVNGGAPQRSNGFGFLSAPVNSASACFPIGIHSGFVPSLVLALLSAVIDVGLVRVHGARIYLPRQLGKIGSNAARVAAHWTWVIASAGDRESRTLTGRAGSPDRTVRRGMSASMFQVAALIWSIASRWSACLDAACGKVKQYITRMESVTTTAPKTWSYGSRHNRRGSAQLRSSTATPVRVFSNRRINPALITEGAN